VPDGATPPAATPCVNLAQGAVGSSQAEGQQSYARRNAQPLPRLADGEA
jgi:hypothetical protein